jgi:hypothetical protein
MLAIRGVNVISVPRILVDAIALFLIVGMSC